MDLQRAYETLGLTREASLEAVEAAHGRLSGEYDDRAARASTAAIRRRYQEARAELDAALDVVRSSLALRGGAAGADDALAQAYAVLGLGAQASPLDVASAYVTLCEELERDLDSAPTEALKRRCLEARAEVDEAYRYCIASIRPREGSAPIESPLPTAHPTPHQTPHQTQMASEPFEGEAAEQRELMIVPAEEPASEAPRAGRAPRARAGRGRMARFATTSVGVLLVLGLGVAGFGFVTDTDVIAEIRRLMPDEPDPRIARAQGDAELARKRITDERAALQARAEEARQKVIGLEEALAAEELDEERERLREELARARARRAVAVDLAVFADEFVFEGSDLALAYGRMELGQELAQATHKKRALRAFAEAETLIEAALERVDQAEQALGARSEALGARDAWYELQAGAELPDSIAAAEGDTVLAGALALLSSGTFDEASLELERAAQLYRVALDDGRRQVAEAAPPASALEADEVDPVADAVDRALDEVGALREALAASPETPPVSSPPPAATERLAIKLVTVPGGSFLEPCREDGSGRCAAAQARGELSLPAFRIDRTEVRVDEYRACVQAGACSAPGTRPGCNWSASGRGDHPINCVDQDQAVAYCAWAGKRLPSDREWEKAARGGDGRAFPWGDDAPSCRLAVVGGDDGPGCGRESTWPVASLEGGRSPYGLFDMAGNVLEWTSDRSAGRAVVRGGSWRRPLSPDSWRATRSAGEQDGAVGFRCAGAARLADNL